MFLPDACAHRISPKFASELIWSFRRTCSWKDLSNLTISHVNQRTWKELSYLKLSNSSIFSSWKYENFNYPFQLEAYRIFHLRFWATIKLFLKSDKVKQLFRISDCFWIKSIGWFHNSPWSRKRNVASKKNVQWYHSGKFSPRNFCRFRFWMTNFQYYHRHGHGQLCGLPRRSQVKNTWHIIRKFSSKMPRRDYTCIYSIYTNRTMLTVWYINQRFSLML